MSSQSVTSFLVSAHETEQKLTYICKDTLPWSACLLTGFIWATGKLCMLKKAFLSLHWAVATKQEKPQSREGKASANAIAISPSFGALRKLKHGVCLREHRGCYFLQDLYSVLTASKQVTVRSGNYFCRLQEWAFLHSAQWWKWD